MQVWLEQDGSLSGREARALFSVSCTRVTTIPCCVQGRGRESFAEQGLEDLSTAALTGTDFRRQVATVEIWDLPALKEPEGVDR